MNWDGGRGSSRGGRTGNSVLVVDIVEKLDFGGITQRAVWVADAAKVGFHRRSESGWWCDIERALEDTPL